MGYIRFFEGNNATQNTVIEVTDKRGERYVLKGKKKDEARSVQLLDVRVGTVIKVYDSPKGDLDDDWCQITVLGKHDEYTIGTFEKSRTNKTVKVTYHRNNGLDGKVSRIDVD